MLHSSMVLRILCYTDSRLVVNVENRWRVDFVAKFREDIAHPQDFLSCFNSSNELGLSCGESNNRLQFAAPADSSRGKFHEIATSRTSIVLVTTMISICICGEEVG